MRETKKYQGKEFKRKKLFFLNMLNTGRVDRAAAEP